MSDAHSILSGPTPAAFLKECYRENPGQRLVVMDVGANNGQSSLELATACSKGFKQRGKVDSLVPNLQLILFEPNPVLQPQLYDMQLQASLLVPPWNVTLITSAVWTVENEVKKFYISNASIVSSMQRANADRFATKSNVGVAQELAVTTIDLARFLRRNLQVGDVVFMKLDIECIEWIVVPHLLAKYALCPVQFLRVEWHFRSPCPGLDGALFNNFESRLKDECTLASDAPTSRFHRFYDAEVDSKLSFNAYMHAFVKHHAHDSAHNSSSPRTRSIMPISNEIPQTPSSHNEHSDAHRK